MRLNFFYILFFCCISGNLLAQNFLYSNLVQKDTTIKLTSKMLVKRPVGHLADFTKHYLYQNTLQISLTNDLDVARTYYIHTGTENIFRFSSIDAVRSFSGMAGIIGAEIPQTNKILYNGYLTPISQRQYPENLQILCLTVPAKQTQMVDLHIFDLQDKKIPHTLKIMSGDNFLKLQNDFIQKIQHSRALSMIYVGAILIMVVFSVAIYSQNKMQDFLIYALYLIFMLFFGILDIYPLSFKDFWGWEYPHLFIYLKEASVYWYLIFYHTFIIYFLKVRSQSLPMYRSFMGINILYAVCFVVNIICILFFFESNFMRLLTWINTFIFYACILFYIYLFVFLWKLKNVAFSRYIFWGSFMFYLGNVIAVSLNIKSKNNYNYALFPNNFIQIGAMAEILFFAVALGRKTLVSSEENNQLQKQIILQLEEKKQLTESINKRLEDEINQKTAKIIAQAQVLQAEKDKTTRLQFDQQLQEIRLYAIQTQLNPHFLFNCLNTIKSLVINQQNDKAAVYLSQFAKLMRSTLENSEKLKINLKESIEYLKNYVEMEKLRFKEDFDFEINFEGEEAPEILQVPPMLIQPFVENAIIHGLVPSQAEKSLKILFTEQEYFLVCTISDNGMGFDASNPNKMHQSKGLKIIQNYFDLWNTQKNEKATFSIESQANKGTCVTVQIPI